MNYITPWLSGECKDDTVTPPQPVHSPVSDCKIWRNPLSLFRGAEYQRFYWATNKEPLTYYDMNLSAQDHQTIFTCETDAGAKQNVDPLQVIQTCDF